MNTMSMTDAVMHEQSMRAEALRLATNAYGATGHKPILEAAKAYYDFITGKVEATGTLDD